MANWPPIWWYLHGFGSSTTWQSQRHNTNDLSGCLYGWHSGHYCKEHASHWPLLNFSRGSLKPENIFRGFLWDKNVEEGWSRQKALFKSSIGTGNVTEKKKRIKETRLYVPTAALYTSVSLLANKTNFQKKEYVSRRNGKAVTCFYSLVYQRSFFVIFCFLFRCYLSSQEEGHGGKTSKASWLPTAPCNIQYMHRPCLKDCLKCFSRHILKWNFSQNSWCCCGWNGEGIHSSDIVFLQCLPRLQAANYLGTTL